MKSLLILIGLLVTPAFADGQKLLEFAKERRYERSRPMSEYQLRAWEIVRETPRCFPHTIRVRNLPLGDPNTLGYAEPGVITVKRHLPDDLLVETIRHECGHIVDFQSMYIDHEKVIFGKMPYVTGYAASDPVEDFAESYSWYIQGKLPDGEKKAFFDKHL